MAEAQAEDRVNVALTVSDTCMPFAAQRLDA
jgi:hypothetical protein